MYPRIILFILFPLFGFSQAPQKINFQSILRNTNGEIIANKAVSLKISILSGSINGSSVYSETHTKTTDASGLISLQIGNGTVLSGIFADIAWGNAPHFIKLEADFSGGNNFVLLGTQELMSVPYALYASKTDTSSLNLVNRFNSKFNISDTISLSNRIDTKSSLSDTSLLNLTNRFSSKVNISDTSNMLANYRTGLNSKVNISDTSDMLNPYLRKADAIIADLQKQVELLSSYTSLLASGLVDIDGNNYPVVKIGNQIWMKENLRVSRYSNGDPIPIVTDNTAWSGLTTGARSWYNNDSTLYEYPYGNLYNWYAASDNRNICPSGWHVPSNAEWNKLVKSIDSGSDTTATFTQSRTAGGKMTSVGTAYWNSPNTGATNESGFSALPGGLRFEGSGFFGIRDIANFWSETEIDNYYAESRLIYYNSVVRGDPTSNDKLVGASVRCLKD